jgi:hypothetical protein
MSIKETAVLTCRARNGYSPFDTLQGIVIYSAAHHLDEGTQPLSVIGIFLQLSYRLQRHFIAGWSLARWVSTLLFVAGLATLIAQRSITWQIILMAGVFLIQGGMLIWAGRKGFVHFRDATDAEALVHRAPMAAPLRPEELVPVQVSGLCFVEGKEQYYVDLAADYESVRSREHIVLARVYPSRFLLLGSWPDYELGWWYIFFQPSMLQRIRVGHLHFGRQPRLALQIVYAPDEETRQTIYLAAEAASLRRIWEDLKRDMSPD